MRITAIMFIVMGVIMSSAQSSLRGEGLPDASYDHLPRWRGFNLTEMFYWHNDGKPTAFHEEDFQMIHQWGFNFVRLPMDYRLWISGGDWTKFDESALKQIDQAVKWGEQYDIHVMINFHRAPGYTVAQPAEKLSVWTDAEALRVCALHWATFAKRYRGVPNRRLSFNLFNEPNQQVSAEQYAHVVKVLCDAIRAEDSARLIVCDGLNWGGQPVKELVAMKVAQATRGYQPFDVTHYKASWAGKWDDAPLPGWPAMRVNQYLYAPTGEKKGWHGPVTISGPFDRAMRLRVRVHQVSGNGRLCVRADDAVVLSHTFEQGEGEGEWKEVVYQPQWKTFQNIYDRDYVAKIPAGTKRITLELESGDWLTLRELALANDEAGARESVLVLRDEAWGKPERGVIGFDASKRDAWSAGGVWGREQLWEQNVEPWRKFGDEMHVGVMVGEFGAYNKTPHDVVLRWMGDCLANWKRAEMGWALWNFRGSFGVMDSERADVQYEDYRGHKLDRAMLELLQSN